MAEVRETISIGSKADTRGFKKTESAANKLAKTLKGLAGTIGVTFGTAQVINFGKASVKAFREAEAANVKLANVIKNLGLSFAQANIQHELDKISASSGIAGETLAQAFQSIATTTGSAVKSQELLNLALDVSKGSGVDLITVSQDLAKAYVGQTRGLVKYNLGLTRGQLTTAKFVELQTKLNEQFGGSNAKFLETYAGRMQVLGEAAENAREIIGKGLVDALGLLAGQGTNDINKATAAMDSLAVSTADVIRGQAVVLSNLGGIGNGTVAKVGNAVKTYFKEVLGIQALQDLGAASRPRPRAGRRFMGGAQANLYDSDAAAQKRFQKEQKKFQDAQLLAEKKRAAELKKQNALKKAGSVFDLEQIQRLAALRGKLSEDDRMRVQAQLAILNENDVLAKDLTRQILMAQDETGRLYQYFLSVGDAKIKNPFEFLDEWLRDFQSKLNNLKFPSMPTAVAAAVAPTSGVVVGFTPTPMNPIPTAGPIQGPQIPSTNASAFSGTIPTGNFTYGQGNPLNTNVYVTVQGSVTTEQDLINSIASGLQQKSLSTGDSSYINRRTGGFAG